MATLFCPIAASRRGNRARKALAALAVTTGVTLGVPALSVTASATSSPEDTLDSSDAAINASLDVLARSLALKMGDPGLRSTIHDAVARRFDGDEEALWTSLVAVSAVAAKVADTTQAKTTIARLAAPMPQLQVAVPRHFDSWDPRTYAPLVAYVPEGVDDTTLKAVTAYDSSGRAVQIDAQHESPQPVIVVGVNERTNAKGKLLPAYTPTARAQPSAQPAVDAAGRATYSVDIDVVHLIRDREPWVKGDAEISMRAKSRGCSGTDYETYNWTGLDNDDDWWAPSTPRNLGRTTCDVVFAWWEDDGGSYDFTLSLKDFSLGVHMDDSDDIIGKKQLPYSQFQGGSVKKDAFDDLDMWTE